MPRNKFLEIMRYLCLIANQFCSNAKNVSKKGGQWDINKLVDIIFDVTNAMTLNLYKPPQSQYI